MRKHPKRNDPEIYDDLLYVGMNETGKVLIPMTGWDVQQIACGSYTDKFQEEWLRFNVYYERRTEIYHSGLG